MFNCFGTKTQDSPPAPSRPRADTTNPSGVPDLPGTDKSSGAHLLPSNPGSSSRKSRYKFEELLCENLNKASLDDPLRPDPQIWKNSPWERDHSKPVVTPPIPTILVTPPTPKSAPASVLGNNLNSSTNAFPVAETTTHQPRVIIHCVRHAQAEHNVKSTEPGKSSYDIRDPPLTLLGHQQVAYLKDNFPFMDRITHILCSPLKRTLQTCVIGFEPLLKEGMRVVCWDLLRECGSSASSKGSSITELTEFANSNPIELSVLSDGWENEVDRSGRAGWTRAEKVGEELYRIIQAALGQLGNEDDAAIYKEDFSRLFGSRAVDGRPIEFLLVSHAGILDFMMGIDYRRGEPSMWHQNAMYKAFRLVCRTTAVDERRFTLEETEDSKRRRMDVYKGPKIKGNTTEGLRSKLPRWE